MTTITKEPVVLEGYQNPFQPSKFGKMGIQAIVDQNIIDELEDERPNMLEWAKGKCKAKRPLTKNEPWEEVSEGKYQVRFSWKPEQAVPFVDSEGTPIEGEIPLYSGSMVKLAFKQKPYTTPDAVGTRLVLQAVQVVTLSSNAGVDMGDMDAKEAANLFGKTNGFKLDDPNIKVEPKEDDTDDF